MDKSWMNKPRYSEDYLNGMESFVQFAFGNQNSSKILCPCVDCKLARLVGRNEAREHLIVAGFINGYNQWIAHGEVPVSSSSTSSTPPIVTKESNATRESNTMDDMEGLVHDIFGNPEQFEDRDGPLQSGASEKFYKLLESSKKSLYEGCESFSKLSWIVHILHLKCLGRWTNGHFDSLLDMMHRAFPEAMTGLPKSYYECEKLMKDLGIGYEKIDACVNDCMLYWGENAKKTICGTCNESRWSQTKKDPTGEIRKVGRKVLWYFPIKPRLQRLFMSAKTASLLRWHAEGRTKDGYMRHPADSPTWQSFDSKYPQFASEPRNIRLGLASDGFNPFSNMNLSHSTWPVVLVPYNLPPEMCMKQPYTMLSLLIPGPSAPGNNIDIYLQPLIADLKDLWENGIQTFDASLRKDFQLRASLMWTINDFPGYTNLSGWSTKGYLACPICHQFTHSKRLKHSRKICYMGHRRFLSVDHKYRNDVTHFDGTEEHGRPPPRLSGDKVLEHLKDINIKFGKTVNDNPQLPFNWKKRSIFFDLPYWKDNVLRHNLDFMHIEKNVCESICGTLLESDTKSKDRLESRLDLKEMGIRATLHPIRKEGGGYELPAALYKMKLKEKKRFCKVLQGVKVPDGYASNISRRVQLKPPKLVGLKSHDYHILMQQLLPIAVRKTLPKAVKVPLIKLSRYFRELCSKVIYPPDVVRLEKEIVSILCELERIFPPSFFDVMVHLTMHLATEVKLGGPVYYRWMYPIERYLKTLKSYVRNQRYPEGSIAQGYVAEECLTFCSMYLAEYSDTRMNSMARNAEPVKGTTDGLDIFKMEGHYLGKGTPKRFDEDTLKKGHQYILFNSVIVKPYTEQHLQIVKENHPGALPHQIEQIHSDEFAKWFSEHVNYLQLPEDEQVSRDLKCLARGPNNIGLTFDKYIVNGFRFHTKESEGVGKTQNSGVTVPALTSCFSSSRDNNPIVGELDYYGVLTNIIEFDYVHHRVALFECDWVSKGSRLKVDSDGFILANFNNVRRHNEPFILASQASQVFYIADPLEKDWSVVINTSARSKCSMEPLADVDTYLQSNLGNPVSEILDEDVQWLRPGVDGDTVDNVSGRSEKRKRKDVAVSKSSQGTSERIPRKNKTRR